VSRTTTVTDFMKQAVREKATRELAALTQRSDALGGVERVRDGLQGVAAEIATATPAVIAITGDTTVPAKLKKLRKLVEESVALATELGNALGVDNHRDAVAASRQAILDALKSADIEASSVLVSNEGNAP